jgi:hypothetical protein
MRCFAAFSLHSSPPVFSVDIRESKRARGQERQQRQARTRGKRGKRDTRGKRGKREARAVRKARERQERVKREASERQERGKREARERQEKQERQDRQERARESTSRRYIFLNRPESTSPGCKIPTEEVLAVWCCVSLSQCSARYIPFQCYVVLCDSVRATRVKHTKIAH